MGKRRLSKSAIRALNERLQALGLELTKKDAVEILDDEDTTYVVNGTPWLFEIEGELIPHLKLLLERDVLKKVTVDMGAVKFVVNGADVMRPGITKVDEGIEKGELVAIVDETHGKSLAVGRALLDSRTIMAASSGKVITSIHYVGDKRWHT